MGNMIQKRVNQKALPLTAVAGEKDTFALYSLGCKIAGGLGI